MNDLIYIGQGRFLVGVPAIDLPRYSLATLAARCGESVVELQRRLLASGLYVKRKA